MNPALVTALQNLLAGLPNLTAALQGINQQLKAIAPPTAGSTSGGLGGILGKAMSSINNSKHPAAGVVKSLVSGLKGAGKQVQNVAAGAKSFASAAAAKSLSGMAAAAGTVAAGLAGLAVAVVKTIFGFEGAARKLLESQRHLAESSAGMASVMAMSDMRKTMRDMKTGQEQSKSAGFLARQTDNLSDTMQPITTLLSNLYNWITGSLAWLLDKLLKPLSYIADKVNKIFDRIGGGDRMDDAISVGKWMDEIANREAKERAGRDPDEKRERFP